jgi:hypothetical protein
MLWVHLKYVNPFCLTGQIIREKRFVEAANKKEIDYEVGNIPTEWEGKFSLSVEFFWRQIV